MNTTMTLYQIEDWQAAMMESYGLIETPEQQAEFDIQLAEVLEREVTKVDSYCGFMASLEFTVSAAKAEQERLNTLQRRCERILDRMKSYVLRAMDITGKRILKGGTHSLVAKQNPPKVQVLDEAAIPAKYKMLLIKVPAADFERLVCDIDDITPVERIKAFYDAIIKADVTIDRTAIKRDWDTIHPTSKLIPGVELVQDQRVERS